MTTRTRHDQGYWVRHLEQWGKSEQTQVQYCVDAGISIKTFQRWKTRLAGIQVRKDPSIPAADKAISLIPVRLASTDTVGNRLHGCRDVQIRFDAGQWIVSVPQDVNAAHLVNVLKAIAGASQ